MPLATTLFAARQVSLVGGRTRNIAIQFACLQQCCPKKLHVFVARLTVALGTTQNSI